MSVHAEPPNQSPEPMRGIAGISAIAVVRFGSRMAQLRMLGIAAAVIDFSQAVLIGESDKFILDSGQNTVVTHWLYVTQDAGLN